MVALYGGGVAHAGLYDVGVYRTLRQEVNLAYLLGLFLEYADELLADYLALALGLGYACNLAQEAALGIHAHEVDVPMLEGSLDLVRLVQAHEAVIDEHAGQLIAHGLGQHGRSHGGIDAARQCQQHAAGAYLLAQVCDGLLAVIAHGPASVSAADAVEEVAYHGKAVLGVVHLGVELHAVYAAAGVAYGCAGAALGVRGQAEALGYALHVVAMAHPGHAMLRQTVEQLAVGREVGLGAAVFAGNGIARGRYLSAQRLRYQLTAVAYAQYRHAQTEYLLVHVGRILFVYAVGAAGEYYAYRGHSAYLLDGHGIRAHLAVHVAFAHAAGYELIVLTAKVKHQYSIHSTSPVL